jgi:hypothetical protein
MNLLIENERCEKQNKGETTCSKCYLREKESLGHLKMISFEKVSI